MEPSCSQLRVDSTSVRLKDQKVSLVL